MQRQSSGRRAQTGRQEGTGSAEFPHHDARVGRESRSTGQVRREDKRQQAAGRVLAEGKFENTASVTILHCFIVFDCAERKENHAGHPVQGCGRGQPIHAADHRNDHRGQRHVRMRGDKQFGRSEVRGSVGGATLGAKGQAEIEAQRQRTGADDHSTVVRASDPRGPAGDVQLQDFRKTT